MDRQLLFRQGLECLFRSSPETTLVGSIADPADVPACLDRVEVDVLLFELDFEKGDPLRFIREWSRDYPQVALLVLTSVDERLFGERAIRAGAMGFVSKAQSYECLLEAVAKLGERQLAVSPALEGLMLSRYARLRSPDVACETEKLSDRELLVLALTGQGQATASIAKRMGVSPKTVGSFKERIKEKLNLRDSLQLARYASHRIGRTNVGKTLTSPMRFDAL